MEWYDAAILAFGLLCIGNGVEQGLTSIGRALDRLAQEIKLMREGKR